MSLDLKWLIRKTRQLIKQLLIEDNLWVETFEDGLEFAIEKQKAVDLRHMLVCLWSIMHVKIGLGLCFFNDLTFRCFIKIFLFFLFWFLFISISLNIRFIAQTIMFEFWQWTSNQLISICLFYLFSRLCELLCISCIPQTRNSTKFIAYTAAYTPPPPAFSWRDFSRVTAWTFKQIINIWAPGSFEVL